MKHIVSRMISYFPNRWPLSYLNLIKNMKTYIRRQQHNKNFKHHDIKQKEPPQKYRLGTISNTKLLAGLNRFYRILTSPSASAVKAIPFLLFGAGASRLLLGPPGLMCFFFLSFVPDFNKLLGANDLHNRTAY